MKQEWSAGSTTDQDASIAYNDGEYNKWYHNIIRYLPSLPWKHSCRNDKLRPDIIRRFTAQLLTDDERAELLGLPAGCRIREGAKIISPENLKIGEYCWIGENAVLDASGGLSIGSHTSIGLSVFVWSHSSYLANMKMANQIGSDLIERKRTTIGSGCFIAGPAVVLSGVTIGDHVLIQPFTTIETDIKSRSIVGPSGIREGVLTDQMIDRLVRKHKRQQQAAK